MLSSTRRINHNHTLHLILVRCPPPASISLPILEFLVLSQFLIITEIRRMSQDLKHSDHLPKSKSEEEACQNERTLINDLRYNNSTTKLVELMLCSTCGARVEPPFRPTGSIPGECSKCSSSKSVYRILQEPSQESSESVHQHKKLRHYLLQRQIKPPSPVNSPGNIGPITEVVAARKRSFPSISHQGPIRIDGKNSNSYILEFET